MCSNSVPPEQGPIEAPVNDNGKQEVELPAKDNIINVHLRVSPQLESSAAEWLSAEAGYKSTKTAAIEGKMASRTATQIWTTASIILGTTDVMEVPKFKLKNYWGFILIPLVYFLRVVDAISFQ
ncbi:hypothetical protein COLO4_34770 [Corchorus olitorius]|uniref:Uncharacterized protein n=1 Tax=Corchorus olitorius TaxID=93759 RepID=A0A1R3GJK0_9ROSI|nr:hypothetical protein COLO4_34770 [Corchorus olitorius]